MNVNSFHFVVVGAGFSGSVIAERIANVLKKNVLLLDRRPHIGGNAYDFNDEGIVVQKYGPHIFHTRSEAVWNYISGFTRWIPYKHRVLAFVKGKFIPLPFNFRSIDMLFSYEEARMYKNVLLKEFDAGSRVSVFDLTDSNNTEIHKLGEFIYRNIFLNYTVKQWGLEPDKIDKSVLKRVPVAISYEDTYFADKHQGIPEFGYSNVFRAMLKNKRIKIVLKTDFSDLFHLDFRNHKILLKDGKEFTGTIFYTGCPDELLSFKFGKLPYRSLNFVFEKYKTEFYQNAAVVNYPNDFEFTRITEFKHFYKISKNETIIAKEFPKNAGANDIPYYPILNKESSLLYRKYEFEANKFKNIVLIGRLANFKYVNMDEAVLNALGVFKKNVLKT